MEQANQDQYEVRSVRRGRPPKVSVEVERVEAIPVKAELPVVSPAESLAKRIWAGQSPDVPRNERLARVERGLAAQGFSMDGIEL